MLVIECEGAEHLKWRRGMGEVMLHVYDVTNSLNGRANSAIVNLNKIMRDGIGLGGIFHGAVQVCFLFRIQIFINILERKH